MKNYKLLFALLVASFNVSIAQTVDKLDAKYGFKIFQLGTAPNVSNSTKVDSWDNNPNITNYKYVGNDISELYTVPVDFVKLIYYKNKLMSINISFLDPFSESDYNIVLYSLQKLFGDGNNCYVDDPEFSTSTGRKWVGNKVEMEIHRLYFTKNSSWGGYIWITEKSLQKQRINDEF